MHGRKPPYLDPEFALPLCGDHHPLVHDHWKDLDLEVAKQPLTWFDRVEVRLRRLAATLMVLDGGAGTTFFGILASVLVKWADEQAKGIRWLDKHDPAWREDEEFYP
jgi:hypothetical protein